MIKRDGDNGHSAPYEPLMTWQFVFVVQNGAVGAAVDETVAIALLREVGEDGQMQAVLNVCGLFTPYP
eukprot:scaffold158408_cov27-Tisochrysis_lutea.AAC.3